MVPGRERQPSTVEEWGEVRVLLQRLGLEMETEARPPPPAGEEQPEESVPMEA